MRSAGRELRRYSSTAGAIKPTARNNTLNRQKDIAMKLNTLIAALAIAGISGAVLAQTPTPTPSTPVIDQRAANQEKRIANGQASGQLTNKEAANLEKREVKLNNDIAKAKSDGTVTAKEKAKLTHEENKDSRKIHRKKHNDKTQAPATPPVTK